jgi:Tol biopolymer transport system component
MRCGVHELSLPNYHPDGRTILFVGGTIGPKPTVTNLFEMQADGMQVRQLTRFKHHAVGFPRYSRNGMLVAFNVFSNVGEGWPRIAVMQRDGRNFRLLKGNDREPEICFGFMPGDGELLVMRLTRGAATRHVSMPWDLYAVSLSTGKRRRITRESFMEAGCPGDVSADGRRAVLTATTHIKETRPPKMGNALFLIDLSDGSIIKKLGWRLGRTHKAAAFSHDGKHVLSGVEWGNAEHSALVSLDIETGKSRQMLNEEYYSGGGCWFFDPRPSPDGEKILFLTMKCADSNDTILNTEITILDVKTQKSVAVQPDRKSLHVLPHAPADELRRKGLFKREAHILSDWATERTK